MLGIPFPLNSVGVLPLSYFNDEVVDANFKMHALFANAKQILAQFQKKSELKKQTTIGFKDFPLLQNVSEILTLIETNLQQKNFQVSFH